jgi:hypothetical protein
MLVIKYSIRGLPEKMINHRWSKISMSYWNLKFHCHVSKIPSPGFNLIQSNPFSTFTLFLFHFNIIVQSTFMFQTWSLRLKYLDQVRDLEWTDKFFIWILIFSFVFESVLEIFDWQFVIWFQLSNTSNFIKTGFRYQCLSYVYISLPNTLTLLKPIFKT